MELKYFVEAARPIVSETHQLIRMEPYRQYLQRESILECAGSAPSADQARFDVNPARVELEFRLAAVEESAKQMPGQRMPIIVQKTMYWVLCE